MLEKHITFVADCDHCGTKSMDTDEHDFMAAVQRIKRAGWKVQRDGHGNWEHVCPGCQEDNLGEDFDDLAE
jgi:hypothetical protein